MRAAEKLFTRGRIHEVTLDDVAQAAKVGKGTIYRYFRDKDDLFLQTATAGFDELCQLLRRRVSEEASFPDQLLEACGQIGRFFERRRHLFRMMQAEEAHMYWHKGSMRERWHERRKNLTAAVAEIIGRGVARGDIRSDVPTDVLASFFLGMVRTRTRHLKDAPESARRHEVVVDLFCHGAAARTCHRERRGAPKDGGEGRL